MSLLLLGTLGVKAQDDVQLSQFFANKLYYTPASIDGTDGKFRASLMDREQWTGFGEGRPAYRMLNATQYFPEQKMGVGLSVSSFTQGIENIFNAKLAYAYHWQVEQHAFLSFGVSAGLLSTSFSEAVLPSGEQLGRQKTTMDLDAGLGVEFYTKTISTGAAVNHLPFKLNNKSYQLRPHYYYYFSYNFYVDKDWSIIPTLVLRNSSVISNVDINLRGYYRGFLMGGVSYRTDAVVVMAGVNLFDAVSLSYSFDINSGLTKKNGLGPTHEIVLSYRGYLFLKEKRAGYIF